MIPATYKNRILGSARSLLALLIFSSIGLQHIVAQDQDSQVDSLSSQVASLDIDESKLQSLFILATQAYDNSDFENAKDKYEQIRESGSESGVLYYNLGNTYFRLNNLGEAMLNYERAYRFIPYNEALQHNMRVARAKTANRFRLLPKPVWIRAWNKLIYYTKPGGLLALGLGFYLLGILALIIRVWRGYRIEWVRRIWMWSLLFGIGFLGLAFAANWTLNTQKSAVVVDTKTPLFDEPENLQRSELELHEGLTVDLLDNREGLIKVRLPDGHTGWISSSAVKEI